jgi:hypothetical protein
MVAERLLCLAQMLRSLAEDDQPVLPDSLCLVAHAIENMLPQINAMESRPIPPRFRVIAGGRGGAV